MLTSVGLSGGEGSWKLALGLKVKRLFGGFREGGGSNWAVASEVDGVTNGRGEEGFWKSLRMSTLVGLGEPEGAGASRFDVDDSGSDNEEAIGFVVVGETIVGRGRFKVELDRFRDD